MRVFFDTETTDLVPNSLLPEEHQPRVIEIYACLLRDDFSVEAELESYIDPGISIPEIITKITGIKPEDVSGAPRFDAVAGEFADMVRRSDEAVAHNLSFDQFVIDVEFNRLKGWDPVPWPRRRTCTVEATEWIKGYRLNLSALHEMCFGEPFEGAHRAKVDVEATVRCYQHCLTEGWI